MNDEADGVAPKKKISRAKTDRAKQRPVSKRTPWTFPKNSLEDAISVAKSIEEKYAGNPMPARDLAHAVGFNLAND
jgi:hypothetical protein